MVFAINPPSTGNTFGLFQENAQKTAGTPVNNDTSAVATSTVSTYTTPAAPSFITVTVTETVGASTWTTTYASYYGSPRKEIDRSGGSQDLTLLQRQPQLPNLSTMRLSLVRTVL
jgi:hypothetical protein